MFRGQYSWAQGRRRVGPAAPRRSTLLLGLRTSLHQQRHQPRPATRTPTFHGTDRTTEDARRLFHRVSLHVDQHQSRSLVGVERCHGGGDPAAFLLELQGPLAPGVFKPIGDDMYVHVVMPVRTTS